MTMLGFTALSANLRTDGIVDILSASCLRRHGASCGPHLRISVRAPKNYFPNPNRSTAFFSSSAARRTQRM